MKPLLMLGTRGLAGPMFYPAGNGYLANGHTALAASALAQSELLKEIRSISGLSGIYHPTPPYGVRTVCYQDSAGTVIATPGTAVGLLLDLSKDPSAAVPLTTNETFTSWTTDNPTGYILWGTETGTEYVTQDPEGAKLATAGAFIGLGQITGTVGKRYEVYLEVVSVTGDWTLGFFSSTGSGGTTGSATVFNTPGAKRWSFSVSSTADNTAGVKRVSGSSGTLVLRRFSVREVPGNHAIQSTTVNKSTLRVTPSTGIRWLDAATATAAMTVTLSDVNCWKEVAGQLASQTHIHSLAVLNGKLYGGTYPNGKLFEWNGTNAWVEVAGQLLSQTGIYSLAALNGKLYGGTYQNGKLFEWNGTNAWVEVAGQLASQTHIHSLAVLNGKLYGATLPNGKLFEWNGTNAWVEVAGQLASQTYILSLAYFNGKLYGGTYPNGKLFEWNGTNAWVEVAGQLASQTQILSLAVLNGKLYGGTVPDGKLFEWNGKNAWVEVAGQLASETYIYSLAAFNGKLYGGTYPNGKLFEWKAYSPRTFVATPTGVVETAGVNPGTSFSLTSPYQWCSAYIAVNEAVHVVTPAERELILRYLARYVPALGANLWPQSSFDSDAGLTLGTGWSVGSGVATKTAGTASNLTAAVGLSASVYYAAVDVTRTAGTVGAYPGSGTTIFGTTAAAASAAYTFVASGSGIGFRGDASYAGTLDNATIRTVL
jgi:hypothetical protein